MKTILSLLITLLVSQTGFGQGLFLGEYKNRKDTELIIKADGSFVIYQFENKKSSSIISTSKGFWETKNDTIKLIPLIGDFSQKNISNIIIHDTLSNDSLYFQVSAFDKKKPVSDGEVSNLLEQGEYVHLTKNGWNDNSVILDINGFGRVKKSTFKFIEIIKDDYYPVRIKHSELKGNIVKAKLIPHQEGNLLTKELFLLRIRNGNLKSVKGYDEKSVFKLTKKDIRYIYSKDVTSPK